MLATVTLYCDLYYYFFKVKFHGTTREYLVSLPAADGPLEQLLSAALHVLRRLQRVVLHAVDLLLLETNFTKYVADCNTKRNDANI